MNHPLLQGRRGPITDVRPAFAGRNGEDYPQTGPNVWVQPAERVSPYGSSNVQPFQSGHANNIPTNSSAEQGRGVGPERQWPHWPLATGVNPFRGLGTFQRDGMDSYSPLIYRPESVAYWSIGLRNEMTTLHQKQRGPVVPIVNQPDSSSYTAVVASSGYYSNPYAAGYTPA